MSGTVEPEPTVQEIKAKIAAVEVLLAAQASIEDLACAIKEVHVGCRIQMAGLSPGDLLFRARPMNERPVSRSQVSYPPSHVLDRFGRANDVNQPMFYGCTANRHQSRAHDNMIGCLWESRAEDGEVFAVSTWEIQEEVPLYPFGFHDDRIVENPFIQRSGRANDPVIVGGSPKEALSAIQRWESAAFTQDVADGEESRYRITVALTKYALDLRWPVESPDAGPHDRVSGIMYPSVANRLYVENVCLRPEESDRFLKLLGVHMLSAVDMVQLDVTARTSIDEPIGRAQVTIFDRSYPCDGSSDISWPTRWV